MSLPPLATRIAFFTGKGGVGKTSLACASAVSLADAGRRVLLVSTDPASNLDEVLGVTLAGTPTPVPGVAGLHALNLDPQEAAREYRRRVIEPLRGALPAALLASIEEQLSGGCTTEIAAFDELTRLLGDPATTAGFDHVLFDTAPTGHTLRLLALPAAWEGFLATNTTGTSCLGPLAGLQAQRSLYQASLAALADPTTTTVVLVARPESSALAEAARTSGELAALGITHQRLVINGVFAASVPGDPIAAALERRGAEALAALPLVLASLPRLEVALRASAPLGIDGLRSLSAAAPAAANAPATRPPQPAALSLGALIDACEGTGKGLILTMGKGGVGKTTLAAAVAVELAHRGHRVHLTTTDPASHVDATIGGGAAGVRVTRIDPLAETRAYSTEVLASAAPGLDEQGRALLGEDLRSPCTEEIAVFRAFARVVAGAEEEIVVIDTAPTGHTLLLLDAAQAYHREVARTHGEAPAEVRQLLPRLRDPDVTRVLLVTLPEATPVHEAAALQEDLRRAGIEPFAWIVNQSLAATATRDPLLAARSAQEQAYVAEVCDGLAASSRRPRVAIVGWQPEPPCGEAALLALARGPRTPPSPPRRYRRSTPSPAQAGEPGPPQGSHCPAGR